MRVVLLEIVVVGSVVLPFHLLYATAVVPAAISLVRRSLR